MADLFGDQSGTTSPPVMGTGRVQGRDNWSLAETKGNVDNKELHECLIGRLLNITCIYNYWTAAHGFSSLQIFFIAGSLAWHRRKTTSVINQINGGFQTMQACGTAVTWN